MCLHSHGAVGGRESGAFWVPPGARLSEIRTLRSLAVKSKVTETPPLP